MDRRHQSSAMCHHVEGRHTPVVCYERRKTHTSYYLNRPVATKKQNDQQTTHNSHYPEEW